MEFYGTGGISYSTSGCDYTDNNNYSLDKFNLTLF